MHAEPHLESLKIKHADLDARIADEERSQQHEQQPVLAPARQQDRCKEAATTNQNEESETRDDIVLERRTAEPP